MEVYSAQAREGDESDRMGLAYMQYIFIYVYILYIDSGVYCIFGCVIWDLYQQIPRYLAV